MREDKRAKVNVEHERNLNDYEADSGVPTPKTIAKSESTKSCSYFPVKHLSHLHQMDAGRYLTQ